MKLALGIVGSLVFWLLANQGLYAMVLPGAAMGFGCAALSKTESIPLGIVCAVGALVLSLGLEWQFFPFVADNSLGHFIKNIPDLRGMTLMMIALGTGLAFWIGRGSRSRSASA
jgi:hypothetical protein